MNDNNPTHDRRPIGTEAAAFRNDEETLVADSRAGLTPSQIVEERLIGMLKSSPLLVSQVQRRLRPGPR